MPKSSHVIPELCIPSFIICSNLHQRKPNLLYPPLREAKKKRWRWNDPTIKWKEREDKNRTLLSRKKAKARSHSTPLL